jgi:hypothetical protein
MKSITRKLTLGYYAGGFANSLRRLSKLLVRINVGNRCGQASKYY